MTRPLRPEELRAPCDPGGLGFASTDELPPLDGVIGQERAMTATDFGIGLKAPGYNLFVLGAPGTGRASMMRRAIGKRAEQEPAPPEYAYVYNFEDPYRPRAVELPPGRGRELREGLVQAVEECEARLPKAFESEDFARRESAISAGLEQHEKGSLRQLEEIARREGFSIRSNREGMTVTVAPQGKPLSPEEFEQLPAPEREALEVRAKALENRVEPLVRQIRQLEREAQLAREQLVHDVARSVTIAVLSDLRRRFAEVPAVLRYLDEMEGDLIGHAETFREDQPAAPDDEDGDEEDAEMVLRGEAEEAGRRFLDRYRVNLLVDRSGLAGAPVVMEANPTYANLFGRIEHRVKFGTLVTDFTLIKAGALHQANGGYLLLEARDLVEDEAAWRALKKALRSGTIRLDEPQEDVRLLSAASLLPEPVPLSVKVVLLGTPMLYYLLYQVDEEFRELFKVKVDFEESLARTPESERLYARFVASVCRELKLRHFTARAVARVVEHGARTVDHQGRLSSRFGPLADLLREANHWAAERAAPQVDAEDVSRAIAQKVYRSSLVEEQLARVTAEGELELITRGVAVGQVNGLAALSIGDHAFGRALRITARARCGRPGLLDIEREAGLGGDIHSKGVMVLAGYLAGRYARDRQLAMYASVASEQNYDEIEGDSASCAELCALLSSLAGAPLRQSLAVTGAVNQQGGVQAVGAVNEKIEGFFDLCTAQGLTGDQGVIIPAPNARHLMLREPVVEAVRAGRFRILTVTSVDETLALLTGAETGERGGDGRFPGGSFNGEVERTLVEWATRIER